jgi:hypothetical protein
MGWAEMRDRMHERVVEHLNDGLAQYRDPDGALVLDGLPVIVERNLMQEGPEGRFPTDAVGVTWRKELLATAARGGEFTFGNEQLVVEAMIADDGHMATAACMVNP